MLAEQAGEVLRGDRRNDARVAELDRQTPDERQLVPVRIEVAVEPLEGRAALVGVVRPARRDDADAGRRRRRRGSAR